MSVRVRPVTIEHHRHPLGIGESRPRLSWVTDTVEAGWTQQAYELELFSDDDPDAVSSGRVESIESVLVAWPWEPLESRARARVRVRVWGSDEGPSAWSEPTALETGLLDSELWIARAVAPLVDEPGDDGEPAFLLRGHVHLDSPVVRARLRATAHGVMTLSINGRPVGDDVLHPGWTSYHRRLRYRTWDVTDLVNTGDNVVGVHLADGWWRGFLGFAGLRDVYGSRTAAFVQLETEHADGTLRVTGSDETWRWTAGAVTRADLYMGETFDARRDIAGWDTPAVSAETWAPVELVDLDTAALVAPTGPPVVRADAIRPVEISTSPSGRTLVDFGQNLVGRLRLRVPAAPAGTTVRVRHAEVLENGELGVRPLRRARATDEFISAGAAREWEPSFTLHGFRYAEVEGWPGELTVDDLEAVVIHTDLRRVGEFAASDPLLDRLHENVVWGMRGNFVDVPTDCPQRDERLGWTGDLQVFAPAASYLYDTAGMLTGWLADLAADQHPDGNVPVYVPWADVDPHLPPLGAEAGWGDAATVVPWVLYERYGDEGIVDAQWASMTAWVDAFARRAGTELDFASGGFSFGDWLDAAAPDDAPWAARLPWQAVATAYLARSARIVRDAARLRGDAEAELRYGALADHAAERYRTEFVTPSGRAAFPSQTAYALGIRFDLLSPTQLSHAGELLAAQVAADGFRIGSGFLGTPLVCDALVDTAQDATAWKLLLQRECPSWLYAVTMGATTIWERWNSMLPDGSINPGDMTSFNHYAFGAVADFLHRRVAGLAPAAAGYRRLLVAPVPTPELEWVRASHDTPYGRAAISWTLEDGTFSLELAVPASSTAEIHLPDGSEPFEVATGVHRFRCRWEQGAVAQAAAAFAHDPA
ncbi:MULTISPECIES: glycoside hydrolase family 78 protein [Microbacterium]|uniref:glycoside hydrolase family 78 protein n=1 Tax=Microbacterium TaxID=33882 RepID=UPI0027843FD4|nr:MULTISPECIES: glycoside hydrolase family 78 protein [Microbacterium]MDQ1075468.1 alpha-L-rhamnosidase [Microbacterium sp. SORGH_AS_0969]MDQ1115702.1 alpha-L-rhamnosidase [Microbacterium testaceum]